MAFDIKSAKPVKSGGFDISSANPVNQESSDGNVLQKTIRQSRGLGALGMLPSSGAEAMDLLRAGAQQLPETPGIISSVAGAISGTNPKLPEPKTEYGKQMATAGNIAQLLSPTMGINARMPSKIGSLERLEAMKQFEKGRKAVSKVVPELQLSKDIESGKLNKAQVELFKLIKKTDNPIEIVNKIRNEQKKVYSGIDSLINNNNKDIDAVSVAKRARDILDKQFKNLPEKELVKIQRFAKEEGSWLDKQGKIDLKSINNRKKWLYEQTQGLQEKQQKGQTVLTSPQQQQVRDAFAQAYKEAIEDIVPDIKPLNSRWSGLEEAKKASSKMAERRIEEVPSNIMSRASGYTLGRMSAPQSITAGIREIPDVIRGKSGELKSQTAKIEKAFKKYTESRLKSDQLRAESLLQSFLNKKPKQTNIALRKKV